MRARRSRSSASSCARAAVRLRTSASWRSTWLPASASSRARPGDSLPPACHPFADRAAGALGVRPLPQLDEREPEQLADVEELPEPLDVLLAVEAMLALLPVGVGEEAELLVVADEPRRRTGAAGELADPEVRAGGGVRHRSNVHVNVRLARCASHDSP